MGRSPSTVDPGTHQVERERAGTVRGLLDAAARTRRRVEADEYRGYDPYDALMSPLFRLPLLRSAKLPRRAAQQLLKRSPVNVRPLLGIRKGYNPVTLALMLHGYVHLASAGRDRREHEERASAAVAELARLQSPGFSGACWGYDFHWEARRVALPAGAPTIVATGFVTNALFAAHELLGNADALALCVSAAEFARSDLNRIDGPEGSFCWSYSPFDREVVLNATMKGARLCVQVASATGDGELRELARRTASFVAAHQRPNGSWPYSIGDKRQWADHFHTAYVLDALAEYGRRTGDESLAGALDRGWRYYRSSFFTDEVVPKYYDDGLYPIDATACAQAVKTLVRFGDLAAAERVATWVVGHMQRPDGSFAYQVRRRYTNRIPYVRWSTAYMFAALAELVHALSPSPQD